MSYRFINSLKIYICLGPQTFYVVQQSSVPLSLAIRSDMACPFNGECGGYMQLAPSLFPLFHPAPFFFLQPPAALCHSVIICRLRRARTVRALACSFFIFVSRWRLTGRLTLHFFIFSFYVIKFEN